MFCFLNTNQAIVLCRVPRVRHSQIIQSARHRRHRASMSGGWRMGRGYSVPSWPQAIITHSWNTNRKRSKESYLHLLHRTGIQFGNRCVCCVCQRVSRV